jgi:hypothetical protein
MALNMYSFCLPLNIVKYQPSFIEIMLNRRRFFKCHLANPEQHFTNDPLMSGRVRGHNSGRGQGLANEAGNAIKRRFHLAYFVIVFTA